MIFHDLAKPVPTSVDHDPDQFSGESRPLDRGQSRCGSVPDGELGAKQALLLAAPEGCFVFDKVLFIRSCNIKEPRIKLSFTLRGSCRSQAPHSQKRPPILP